MSKGFIYDPALCVNCKACMAACMLENGFQPGIRDLYVWNNDAYPCLEVVNLSLACNHCANPLCLTGCPASAYSKEEGGIVVHHREKCIGCRYCTWRCPYNAPKINSRKGYIEKCNYCMERTAEGIEPACVSACPTGAIKSADESSYPDNKLSWFPDKGLKPSVIINIPERDTHPVILPEEEEYAEIQQPVKPVKITKEWSLLLFSLLLMTGAVIDVSSFLSDIIMPEGVTSILYLSAALISLLHLGVPVKAWRAGLNVLRSPLSREIVALMLLCGLSITVYALPGKMPLFIIPALALLTLLLVDDVYLSADRSLKLTLHSGQVFFSSLMAISFFGGFINAFLVFTLATAASVVFRYRSLKTDNHMQIVFYLRAFILPATLIPMTLSSGQINIITTAIFVLGILCDRILFYEDFAPVNIKEKINEDFYSEYEKERDKQCTDSHIP